MYIAYKISYSYAYVFVCASVCVYANYWLVHTPYYIIVLWAHIYRYRFITQKPVRYTGAAGRVGVRPTAGATDARGRPRPAPCEASKSPHGIYYYYTLHSAETARQIRRSRRRHYY